MRVAITGAAGFIGAALAERLLADSHTICGIDSFTDYYDVSLKHARHKRLEAYQGYKSFTCAVDDADAVAAAFDEFEPEAIVHLAAQAGVRYSLTNPRPYIDTNVTGSFNVIEAARRHNVSHLLMASTSSAYGVAERFPVKETDRTAFPITIYAATKLASELIAHSQSHLYDIPTTMLRFFTVYGPWGRPDMAPWLFTDRILAGKAIDVFNGGDMARDFTHVADIVAGMAALLTVPPVKGQQVGAQDSLSPVAPFRVVNIGAQQPVNLMDFITAIEDSAGRKAILNPLPMQPGDVTRSFADSTLLHDLTGYTPGVGIKDGVESLVTWFRAYHGLP